MVMVGISFWRIVRAALQNSWRNIWLTAATTVIMTITLILVTLLYFANIFGSEVLRSIEQKVDLSVTFRPEATPEQISAVARDIEARGDVEQVEVITSEAALELFRSRNVDKPFLEEALKELETNPLPAGMFITATEPRFYQTIAHYAASERFDTVIAEVHYEDSRAVIERLISIITTIKNFGFTATIIFAGLAILIMFNTVRLAIYSFREEIDIMHLVGASRWFIRGPFLFESVLVALIAVALSMAVVYPSLRTVMPQLQSFFFDSQQAQSFNLYEFAVSNWLRVLGLQAAFGISLATISSLIALQRYLRV
jgi:cell division transport system permease protein